MSLDEIKKNWLLLTDYASKYRVSISTLRRRIKTQQMEYRLDSGRYYLLDEEPTFTESLGMPLSFAEGSSVQNENFAEGEVTDVAGFSNAKKLLNELKRTYSKILQEKEEQILQLKEEVSDLKTLVRVLESENDRLAQK